MGAFLYFAEIYKPQMPLEQIESLGLSYAFDEKPIACRCERGPSGDAGIVFGRDGVVTNVGFYPDRQTWVRSESGEFWIGYEGQKPIAADLERPEQLRGNRVKLANDEEWLIPVARSIKENEEGFLDKIELLPCAVGRRDGAWVLGAVRDKYRRLWEVANSVFDKFAYTDGTITVEYDEAAEAIAANYYVGVDEVALLQLFTHTGTELRNVLATLVDLETYIEYGLKKKQSLDTVETSQVGGLD